VFQNFLYHIRLMVLNKTYHIHLLAAPFPSAPLRVTSAQERLWALQWIDTSAKLSAGLIHQLNQHGPGRGALFLDYLILRQSSLFSFFVPQSSLFI
jgi:hypothetical protein